MFDSEIETESFVNACGYLRVEGKDLIGKQDNMISKD